MAKTKISEFSSTPANNTDIDSINIAEGCAPSGINDAIRELMAQLKDFQTGAVGDSFNGPIGTSTAAAGAFTTLSATGAITSTLATGTAPLVIASTTKVSNLNVDLLDGADWASPAALGSTTPAAVSATTLSASSTVTLSGGTANGVAYLNGSKVVTSGSALTFDGQTLTNTRDTPILVLNDTAASNVALRMLSTGGLNYIQSGISAGAFAPIVFTANGGGSEQMRLTSTGLGIGTSSPASKLHVDNGSGCRLYVGLSNNIYEQAYDHIWQTLSGASTKMTLDSSGNLGLGVTPSAWQTGANLKAFQVGVGAAFFSDTNSAYLGQNVYQNSVGTSLYINTNYASKYQQSSSVHSWHTAPSGTAGNAITFTQAMTLDASGRLGIGTTSPGAQLTVIGSAAKLYVDLSGDNYYDAANHVFRSFAGTERARIDSSGNLLVGTTSVGPVNANAITIEPANSRIRVAHGSTANGTPYIQFDYNGSNIGSITQNTTTSVLYNVTSDQRLKENIVDAPEFGSVIDSIQVRSFDWKENNSHQRAGFIAQELVIVAPEAVHQPEDPDEMMAVDYSKLVPMLVKEIQSLRKRLADAGL